MPKAKKAARKTTRRKPARRKTTKKRRNPISKTAAQKRAKKAAATRKRNQQARVRAAKKAAATRKRRARKNPTAKKRRTAAKRRKVTRRKNPRISARSNPRRKKRSSTRKRRRNTSMARSAPRGRRAPVRRRRRRRRNPANGMMGIVSQTLPIASSLYLSRVASQKLAKLSIPGWSSIPAQFQGPAMAGVLFGAGHFATKTAALQKWRSGIMIGLGLNLLDSLLIAFAPDNVKSMFGLADYGEDIYGPSLSEYMSLDDYLSVGDAPPIEDDIALSDYVAVGDDEDIEGLEEELGADVMQDLGMLEQDLGDDIYQDLGAEMDLGATRRRTRPGFANRRLGGVARSAMQAPIQSKRYIAPVPARSFTKEVPGFGAGFDKPNKLYTGIFAGGFGY